VTGSTHIGTHYFENGNLQLGDDRNFTGVVSFSVGVLVSSHFQRSVCSVWFSQCPLCGACFAQDPASFGAAVAGYLAASEDDLQVGSWFVVPRRVPG
jgi:hypothetical protein